MENGWLAVIRIWRMYANNPIFAVLYLSFNFEMSPCGPSNKKSSLKRDRDVLGGGVLALSEVES
jgi:hypothetical protein